MVGAGTSNVALIAPSATSGVPLISQGASADPTYGTAVVAGGGTGATSFTSNGVLYGNSTSAIQVTAQGAANTVLTANAGAPSFSATPTVTSITFGAGNALSTYVTGTWTPGVNFGGGTTGITYSTQAGYYTQIGNVVYCIGTMTLSNKGSSTGIASITGLPVATGGNSGNINAVVGFDNITLTASYTGILLQGVGGGSTLHIDQFGSGVALAAVSDTGFSNTSSLYLTFFYLTV